MVMTQERRRVAFIWPTWAWLTSGSRWWVRAPDILGVLWVLGAAGAVMAPALAHGTSLGPFDLLSRYGLSQQPGVIAHNAQATDQIAEMIPWTTLAWTQVHHGQLPLWDPYSALGLPLAFNWQSGVFAAPALLGYLAPMHLAYTVQVLVTLALAGTGAYIFARVLGLGVMGSVMAGTIYELSGAFMGFLGWPIGSVMAWAGWIFAATTLVLRGRHRFRAVAFLAVVGAGAVYAGQPDALVVLGPSLLVFVVVVFVREQRGSGPRPVMRALVDLVAASGIGLGLSAPLLLPGLQLIPGSVFRNATRVNSAISLHSLTSLMLPGYSATSLAHSRFFSVGASDYVGVIAIVLAAMALVLRGKRPEVLAVGAVGVVMFALTFVPPVASVMNQLPFRARWHLGVVVVSFAIAVLAGVGVDIVVKSGRDWAVRTWVGAGFGISILVLAALWVVGRGTLTPPAAHQRADSFIWPAVEAVVGLAACGLLSLGLRGRPDRTRWWAGAVLIACETAFLAGVGASLWSSSPTFLEPTTAEVSLVKAVGSSVVGFGARSCEAPPTIGILPEANTLIGVRELSAYDPITPQEYFQALHARPTIPVSAFCPVIRTAAVARLYGVGFVLVHHGQPGPVGGVYDQVVGDEDLYRIPGVALATLVPDTARHALPAVDAPGRAVAVTELDPATRRLVTDAAGPTVLRLRLTDVPGWHATIDGNPLALQRFAGVILQTRIPPGRHVVQLHYLPAAFTVGIATAALSAFGLAGAGLIGWSRRRRQRPELSNPR
jgi:hypothetical protein